MVLMFHGAEKQSKLKAYLCAVIPSVMFTLVTDAEKEKLLEKKEDPK